MAHRTKQDHLVWLSISAALHTALIVSIFVSLVTQPLFAPKEPAAFYTHMLPLPTQTTQPPITQQKSEETFKVPAPVIFYGQELDPNKKPGTPKQAAPITQPLETVPLPIEQEPTEILSTKSFFEATETEKKRTTAPKKPTLTDIFNHARSTLAASHVTDAPEGEGSGQPVVIREGDMKYYSLWATFLKHLNDTARFNRIRKPVPLDEWIRTKKIKQNLQCAITINKKGEVLDSAIITSSGYEPFDQLCIKDIWDASPFPPLSDQLGKETACFEVKSYL